MQVSKRILRVVLFQFDSLESVLQIQLTPISVIGIHNINERPAVVGQTVEQLQFDFLKLSRSDLVVLAAVVKRERKHLVLLAEFRRQKGVDECDVVVDSADFKNFLTPESKLFVPALFFLPVIAFVVIGSELTAVPTFFDVPIELDPDLVWIDSLWAHRDRPAVMIGVVNHFSIGQSMLGHERGVPVTGPSFVHDLCLPLGCEVVRLIADDRQDVVLPVSERCMLQ